MTGRMSWWVDGAVAAALCGLGAVDLFTGDYSGPLAGNAAFVVLAAAPLVWRRRSPVPVAAVVMAMTVAWSSLWYLTAQPPFMPFVALLLCLYSAAASARSLTPVLAIFALGLTAEIVALLAGRSPSYSSPAWLLFALDLGLARIVHRQRALARALAERTVSLEVEREENARLAVALERARIARELHDVITHNVSIIVIQAGVERRMLGRHDSAVGQTGQVLGTIETIGRDTLVELRRLLGVLRRTDDQPGLSPPPSLERLDDLVGQIRRAGLPVELRVEGIPANVPAGVELSAYRIVQEALTNALRHAGPASACVVVRFGSRSLDLCVTDDGAGHAPRDAVATTGHGLAGMKERVALHGGTFTAGPGPAGGYAVHAELPLSTP